MNERYCPNCNGTGRLITECCNGKDGCSCKGGLVDVGICHCCDGTGHVDPDNYDPNANVRFLKNSLAAFAGSGPNRGYFFGSRSLNGNPLD